MIGIISNVLQGCHLVTNIYTAQTQNYIPVAFCNTATNAINASIKILIHRILVFITVYMKFNIVCLSYKITLNLVLCFALKHFVTKQSLNMFHLSACFKR